MADINALRMLVDPLYYRANRGNVPQLEQVQGPPYQQAPTVPPGLQPDVAPAMFKQAIDAQQAAPTSADSTVTPDQAAQAIAAIRTRLAQQGQQFPTPQEDSKDTFTQHDFSDATGSRVTVYSTDNKPRPVAELQQAAQQFVNTGQSPKGMLVLKPSWMNTIRSAYETLKKPTTEGLTQAGAILDKPLSMILGETPAQNVQVNKGIIESVVPQDLAEAGMTAGMLAAAPFMGPVTATTALGKAGAPLITRMLMNAGIMGTAATAGRVLGKYASGEQPTFKETIKEDVVIPFIAATGMQGFTGVASHFITRYMSPDVGNKIATEVLDSIKKQYPGLASDPMLLEQAASSAANLAKITQVMSKGLRGDLDTLVSSTVTDINQVLPRNLSKGTQNTVRSHIRAIVNAGNDMLDNVGDAKSMAAAQQAMATAAGKLHSAVNTEFAASGIKQQTLSTVDKIVFDKVGSLAHFIEGAQVLSAMKKSGAANGWNPSAFIDTIRGTYQETPGSLLERIGQIAGQGTRLTDATMQSPSRSLAGGAWNLVKDYLLPSGMSRMLPSAPVSRAATPLLPWQQPQGISRAIAGPATTAGTNAAIKSFFNED
jgi:hypothetical protein